MTSTGETFIFKRPRFEEMERFRNERIKAMAQKKGKNPKELRARLTEQVRSIREIQYYQKGCETLIPVKKMYL